MQIADEQIRQSVEELWTTTLGLAIDPGPPPSSRQAIPGRSLLTACVQITGEWQGALTIDCTRGLARLVTAIMFGVEPAQTTENQIQDALGELTNILSGQFKTLLPRSCRLSMPAVLEGLDHPFQSLDDKVIARLAFTCRDEPMLVTIVEGIR